MIRTVAETGSTSADLRSRLAGGEAVAEGDWLVADRQTAGRGRLGRDWSDGAGNFMGSTVVHCGPLEPPPPSLALVAGLAVQAAVAPHVTAPAVALLKWPNDVMIGRAKLAGILLEMVHGVVVVGIGVNLAQAPGVAGRETVALSRFGPPPSRDHFAAVLARCLAEELARWRQYGLAATVSRWLAAAHPPGTPLTVSAPDEGAISGRFAGLDESGALRLSLADGTTRTIHAGEVFLA
ncbi:MAG: biotin--[acetyl-CoA-carboxylase] ligase [Sphingomonadales bacterium]|nr:biotin--[acetyl-CoA-carboxylase] ligase [Sphingomonadales bacterium]